MRLKDLLDRVDTLRPSQYDAMQKAAWVGTLQKMIYEQVLSNYEGYENYVQDKNSLDGRTKLSVLAVEDDNRIIVGDGPQLTPYNVIGQRVFCDRDYYTVTDTDYEWDDRRNRYVWGITLNGNVSSRADYILPSATVFRQDSDELLLDDEWEEMYILWLTSKMDFYNSEIERYNNDALCFNALFEEFKKYYIRNHKPLKKARIKRIGEFNA